MLNKTEPATSIAPSPEFTVSPPMRPRIRDDFPDPIINVTTSSEGSRAVFVDKAGVLERLSRSDIADKIIASVKTQLAKDGLTLETAPPISIAFPQRLRPIAAYQY